MMAFQMIQLTKRKEICMLFDIMNELFDDLNYWENLSGGYSSEIKYVVHTSNDVYIVRFSDRELYPRRKK